MNKGTDDLKTRIVGMAALALCAGALLVAPVAASAATVTVNDDATGPGPSGATCAAPDFATVQAALDAATGPADTINVCAGTYEEALVVDTGGVTLRGAQAGIDARDRAGAAESTVNLADGSSIGLAVNAGDFTLDGFTITDTPNTGIRVGDGADHDLVNNVISNTAAGTFLVGDDGGTDTFRHNLFDANIRNPGSGNGIQTSGIYTASIVVDENAFRDHDSAAVGLQRAGSAEITDNTTDDDATFFVGQNAIDASVTGNEIVGATGTAIYFAQGNVDVVVRGNTITGLSGGPSLSSGIRMAPDFGTTPANQNVDIVGNTITGRSAGIRVDDGMHAGALDVHFNRIVDNGVGIRFDDDDAANSVAAEHNWWGCNEGPGAPGCGTITGVGAARVDADPRLVLGLQANPATVFTGGAAGVTATLTRDSAGATPSPNLLPPTPVAFTTTLGSIPPTGSTAGGAATVPFLAGQQAGTAALTASLDAETAAAEVVVAAPPQEPPVEPPPPAPGGTTGDDTVVGTAGDDTQKGLAGDDVLRGGEGDDRQDGGAGDDVLKGGAGDDKLKGGAGRDKLKGGAGDDVISASDGSRDIVSCGPGDDKAKVDGKDKVASDCERVT